MGQSTFSTRQLRRPTSCICMFLMYFLYQLELISCESTAASSAAVTTPSPPPPSDAARNNPDRALLAFEKVLSGALVAGKNISVSYNIYNVGLHPATDISLRDTSYPPSRFSVVHETEKTPSRKHWKQINAGDSVAHSFIIEPRKSGELFISLPSLTYTDERSGARHVSRIPGNESLNVEELLDYRRRTDTHAQTWIIYMFATVCLAIVPYIVSQFMFKSLSSISNPQQQQQQQPKKSQ